MQIICNNCGHELEFPNQQIYITCPHCYTNLQIEETDNTITATIVENPDLNNSLFMSLNQITTIQSFKPLYNLLHLELEYNEEMEENFFRSLLVGKQFRPVMSRGIYRFITGLLIIAIWLSPNVFNWISVLIIVYGGFLVYVGIKEIIKSWRFRQFEKYYFKEQAILNKEVQDIELSNELNTWYFNYSKNVKKHLDIREKFFYINLFDKVKINILTPMLSQGVRLIVIIVTLVGFMVSYQELMVSSVTISIITIITIIIIQFASIINKSSNYTSKYLTLLNNRKEIIEELKEKLSQ
ncbi:MAG: hypothetical protein AB8G11_04645 [Saprospiraceae bacterium]